MTSKNSFFLSMKENIRRRSAVLMIFAIYFFFAFPVATALKINNYLFQSTAPNASTYDRLYDDLTSILGLNNGYTIFFVIILAVLCGVQGFSWLHSRPKVDMYHSLPVSKNRRFATIYLNGILSFALMYLGALAVSCLLYRMMWKAPDAAMLKSMAVAYVLFLLLFTCVYNLSILSVMLTGNTVITCFAIVILMFYECIIRFLFLTFGHAFYDTYWNPNAVYTGLFTPFNNFLELCRLHLTGSLIFQPLSKPALLLYAYLVLSLVLALVLYRLRPAEGCSKAVAFPALRPFLKFFLLVPFALFASSLFFAVTNGSIPFSVFGLLIGLLLGHCILEIILDFDLKSALHHKKSLLLCSVAGLLFFSVYSFDLFGYDRFVPSEQQLVSAAWIPIIDTPYASTYAHRNTSDPLYDPYETMELTDKETILALAELSLDSESLTSDLRLIHTNIVYTLQGGRKVYRTLRVDYDAAEALLNRLYTSPEYKKAVFPLYQEKLLEYIDSLKPIVSYYCNIDGSERKANITLESELQELFDAYCRDYDTLDFTTAYSSIPYGYIELDAAVSHSSHSDLSYEYGFPVYPNFTNTLAWLSAHDIVPYYAFEPKNITLCSITGQYYDESIDQYVSIVADLSDPAQILSLQDLVVPGSEYFYNYNTGYYVDLTITAYLDDKHNKKKAVFYFKDQDSVPDFVRTSIVGGSGS